MKKQQISQILLLSFILLVGSLFTACKPSNQAVYLSQKYKVYDKAAVSTAHPLASSIAVDILKIGGNAIDASIAAHFALAVCYPIAGNIGGGGFLVYRDKNGVVSSLDYREKAPMASTETMYQDSLGEIIPKMSILGHNAVAVPGTVDGMYEAFRKYSQLKDWKSLLQPAIDLAEIGFQLSAQQASNLNSKKIEFQQVNDKTNVFSVNTSYKKGDIFVQKDLSTTLSIIADKGREGFYAGDIANKLIAEIQRNGGMMSLEDLTNYQSIWREPIQFSYKNNTIYSMGPPSSGGIMLAQLFHSVEDYPLDEWGFHNSNAIHLIVEAEKRAYADRAKHIGDSDFYPVPVSTLISEQYTKKRMEDFSADFASDPEILEAGNPYESNETTHFSIIDVDGNAVSITTTLNAAYGSKVVVQDAGFLLNNEMDDFSSKIGVPNLYGLVGAEANKIEAGKRMVSSMTPTIVEKDGELFIVVGTPGGSTIITSVFQTILNIVEYNMTAGEAVQANRFHHQWKPIDVFYEENTWKQSLIDSLSQKGHQIDTKKSIGRVEALVVRNGKIEAAADRRGDDDVEGY